MYYLKKYDKLIIRSKQIGKILVNKTKNRVNKTFKIKGAYQMSQEKIWFITGSQDLYGDECLRQVAEDTKHMVEVLNGSEHINLEIVWKPTVTTPDEIRNTFLEASTDQSCVGIITWMHTFSPSKMWINGLKLLTKPVLHLHTQANREIPWDTIDMDFMNLNQAAHGDREHGFIYTRMGINRKVVVGYYEDESVQRKIGKWSRVARAASLGHELKVARLGDNMREVAVTEGDKVEAQVKFGWAINGYGVGGFVEMMNNVTDAQIDALMQEYQTLYTFADNCKEGAEYYENVREQARMEIALDQLFEETGAQAFSNTFQDLYGMKQLPGLATQRMMAKGYGYGGEGDWKISALTRVMKMIADNKGTSFMEDYTYDMAQGNERVLGAHMLEVCPTIAEDKPRIEVHPLGIGGKEAPARLVFNSRQGDAVCACLIDMGGRFRLIIAEVEAVAVEKEMPKLPVARALWKVKPSMEVGVQAWILAGGAHHTVFSYEVTTEDLIDWAEMLDIEYVVIDEDTKIETLKQNLRMNELLWKLR